MLIQSILKDTAISGLKWKVCITLHNYYNTGEKKTNQPLTVNVPLF